MKEEEIQASLRHAIDNGSLPGQITGWETFERALSAATSPTFDPYLTLDDMIRHRVAAAGLRVREHLNDLEVISDHRASVSLDSKERLFPDLLCASPESGAAVVFEIKSSRATARETATELLAYEHEVRNQLPFLGRSQSDLVVVSTEFSPLLDHSMVSLIAWHRLQVLCLKVEGRDSYSVHFPSAWTTLGQWRLDASAVEVMDVSFYPDKARGELSEHECWALLSTALDLIRREGEHNGTTGFAFVWSDVLYPRIARSPCGMTVARVNPVTSALDTSFEAFLGGATSPLRQFVADSIETWSSDCTEVVPAQQFLSAFGDTEIEGLTTWDRLRHDRRHRSNGFIMDRRARPLEFVLWGALGDYGAQLFANPERLRAFYAGHVHPGVSLGQPTLAMRLIDQLVVDESVRWLSARWFSSLGFRLGRLRTYLSAFDPDRPEIQRQLAPLLAWAEFDVAGMAAELEQAARSTSRPEDPPLLRLGSEATWGDPATIEDVERLAEWVKGVLAGDDQPVMRAMFDLPYKNAWLLDRYIPATMPSLDATPHLSALAEVGRERIRMLLGETEDSPERFEPLVALVASVFHGFDVSVPFGSVEEIPDEEILGEFVTGIPGLYDLLIEPLGLGLPAPGPITADWDGIEQRVTELISRGVPAVVSVDVSGIVGLAVLPDALPLPIDPAIEALVLVREGLVSVTVKATWEDLRSGQFLSQLGRPGRKDA